MRKITGAAAVLTIATLNVPVWAQQKSPPATQPRPSTTAPAAPATGQADIPVKHVVLFSSGVGYFEHFGSVSGSNRTELRFKTTQINDILKSLVLQDLDGGKISTITYPSQDPLAKTLKSFQVDITANPSLAELLNQLRGAKVTIEQANEKTKGTILGVEKQNKPVGDKDKTYEVQVLNLITGTRMIAIPLESISALTFDDPGLQDELTRALAALAQARDQDKKPVQIAFEGAGDRRVRVGYVVETPVWKTSYRLVLSRDQKPKLQGWAIVENQTDNDWNNVQLSLVSGRPISFIQDLYQPLYASRPTVQPELYAGLTPQRYEESISKGKQIQKLEQMARRSQAPAAAAAPVMNAPTASSGSSAAGSNSAVATSEAMDMDLNNTSVASAASTSKVGELFQYTVGNVSLPRQKSAMIPIITDEIEIEKLSIYNQSVLPRNPLNGARLKNTTGKHLLAGPVTVFDGSSYAGDAQINTVPPTQDRLISYGIDQQVTVDASKNKTDQALLTGKIVRGVLELQRKQLFQQEYVIDNKSDAEKHIIIEHPVRQNWELVDTDKPIESTDTLYRFKGAIPARQASKFTVKQQTVYGESVALLSSDLGPLVFYAKAGEIPEDVKKSLSRAIELRRGVSESQKQLDDRKAKAKDLTEQQKHTADIMRSIQQNTAVYQRLTGKLNDLQTDIEKVQGQVDELESAVEQANKELNDYLANLTVG
ncbi:MAG TPA: DUF4139 domain-containing protein [Tepidisphaeraceae bacterium]